MVKIMTPGPTQVRENVLKSRSLPFTNPDLDLDFYEFYKETCDLFKEALDCSQHCLLMGGEGILGLEAACASLTEPGDRVLVIDNGIFGKGFADFVDMYEGVPVSYVSDYRNPLDVKDLRKFLEKDSDFKYATLVHCDTPSGVLNPVAEVCALLHEFGILTVVDSVAGMFGEYVSYDKWDIDVLCGGSQKALSAPPGLTIVWLNDRAFKVMEERKTPIRTYYGNLLLMKNYYEDKWFPYTMPASDIIGIRTAIENVLADKDILKRHKVIAEATRKALTEAGLKLYLESGYSATVTVFEVPEGLRDSDILMTMKDSFGIMIAGSFDVLAGKVLRIGHMGENANKDDMIQTMDALDKTFAALDYPLKASLKDSFIKNLK